MKKNYIQPSSVVLQMSTAPMMVSGSLSDDSYSGIAGAKDDGGIVIQYEEDDNGNMNTAVIATRKYFNLWED